jgi:hypothetical protein
MPRVESHVTLPPERRDYITQWNGTLLHGRCCRALIKINASRIDQWSRRSVALRDFDPAYVGSESFATNPTHSTHSPYRLRARLLMTIFWGVLVGWPET